jgi:hypothetical protein
VREKYFNLFEAAFTVWISYWAIPRAQTLMPHMPAWVPDGLTPVAAALFVGTVSLILWQRPTVEVAWKTQTDRTPLRDIRVSLRAPHYASEQFEVSFGGRPKGVLTIALMWWLRKKGLRLLVHPVGAPVAMTVAYSSTDRAGLALGAADENGFSMRAVAAPQPRTWMWAKVFFQSQTSVNDTFSFGYGATASTKMSRLMSRFVRVTSNAEDFISSP